jgi:hypothetical protein
MGFRMKHVQGEPKPYYWWSLSVVFVPDNRSFGFAIMKNLDRCILDDNFNGVLYIFQL